MKNKLILFLSTILLSVLADAQEWTVPSEEKTKAAPFKFTEDTKKTGEQLFMQNCTSCHGTPGQNNFTKLDPPPGDPATDKFQSQTDGALFYKIKTGKGAMPSFNNVLTESERWSVISYIRSFNKSYVQPEPLKQPAGKYSGIDLKALLSYDSIKKNIDVALLGISREDTSALQGLEVSLIAKRYFGELRIDEPKVTNDSGLVRFAYSKPLPGDKEGNVIFSLRFNAEGLQDYKIIDTLQAGTRLTAGSLIDTRAMWTVARDAPIWLILSYTIVVGGIWAFLIYIILQIVKIRKLGKPLNKNEA